MTATITTSAFDCGRARIRSHFRHLATVVTIDGEIDAVNVDRVIERTNGVTASFIKELMRRVAQASTRTGTCHPRADLRARRGDVMLGKQHAETEVPLQRDG